MYTYGGTKSFKNMAEVRYFEMDITLQIYIREEIMSGLNLGNVSCPTVQNFLSFCLLF
jgi:hypothetical protein